MPFKTVLSIIDVTQSDRDLDAAIELCAEINAHLSVLVVALVPPVPIGGYAAVLSAPWLQERQHDIAALKARVKTVNVRTSGASLSSDVDSEYSEMAWVDEVIGERARYADLTIIGPALLNDGELKKRAIDGALFESGKPLLLLPAKAKPTLRPKTILLAWDSSFEAMRAAREALELMVAANSVHITLIDPEATLGRNGPEPGTDVATYLVRHGIKVTVDRLPSAGAQVADVLRQHANDISADMIVMGAYGHSRMRERIFGGVTRSLLDEPSLPVLLAH
jgi:nucleotide-binding universal stress UspA family protein